MFTSPMFLGFDHLEQMLERAAAPVPISAIESRFKGRGPWKKSLPRILETLEALGRAERLATPTGECWRG